jgi:hypothetical protein
MKKIVQKKEDSEEMEEVELIEPSDLNELRETIVNVQSENQKLKEDFTLFSEKQNNPVLPEPTPVQTQVKKSYFDRFVEFMTKG